VKRFSPGNLAPISGIYIAIHPEHRLVHEVTITVGDLFPLCRICGGRVNFQLWRQGKATDDHNVLVPFSFEWYEYETLAV